MQLGLLDNALWCLCALLELTVCMYAIRRRLYARLPIFTSYLVLLIIREAFLWATYHYAGYASRFAFYYAWGTQGILLAARGLVIAELSWRVLRAYRGIWALGWRLLLAIFGLLLLNAARDAYGNTYWITPFILTGERGLELAAVVVLVALLFLSRYYGIPPDPLERMIILGLGFYAVVQVVNNTVINNTAFHGGLTNSFHAWNRLRMFSFDVAMVFWWLALRKPLPTPAPAPALLSQQVYDEVSPQVNERLRALNQRLLEMFKS